MRRFGSQYHPGDLVPGDAGVAVDEMKEMYGGPGYMN